jgi:hypothetical protein
MNGLSMWTSGTIACQATDAQSVVTACETDDEDDERDLREQQSDGIGHGAQVGPDIERIRGEE